MEHDPNSPPSATDVKPKYALGLVQVVELQIHIHVEGQAHHVGILLPLLVLSGILKKNEKYHVPLFILRRLKTSHWNQVKLFSFHRSICYPPINCISFLPGALLKPNLQAHV